MTNDLSNILILLGVAILFVVLWVASIIIAYLDVSRRNLSRLERVTWVALVALLPVIGLFVYLIIRFLTYFLIPDKNQDSSSASSFRHRQTMAWQRQPEPVGMEDHSGTIPMADIYPGAQTSGPARQAFLPVYSLHVIMGPHVGEEYPLNRFPALVGRVVDSPIRLNDDNSVSRKHAEFYTLDGEVRIRDLGSTHGTYVNELRVMDAGLNQGDQVRVGASVMVLRVREGAPASGAPWNSAPRSGGV